MLIGFWILAGALALSNLFAAGIFASLARVACPSLA